MICAACGRVAEGYATGSHGERLCHTDDRNCYRRYVIAGYRLPWHYHDASMDVVPLAAHHGAGSWPPVYPGSGEGCER